MQNVKQNCRGFPPRPPIGSDAPAQGEAEGGGVGNEEEEEEAGCSGGVSMDAGGSDNGGGNVLPQNARIVCFPLDPKPHQVEDGWVGRLWRGDDGGKNSPV